MIHELAFAYKINPNEAALLTEYDFYRLIANENLKAEKQEYIYNSQSNV